MLLLLLLLLLLVRTCCCCCCLLLLLQVSADTAAVASTANASATTMLHISMHTFPHFLPIHKFGSVFSFEDCAALLGMFHFFFLISRQGKCRLAKWYLPSIRCKRALQSCRCAGTMWSIQRSRKKLSGRSRSWSCPGPPKCAISLNGRTRKLFSNGWRLSCILLVRLRFSRRSQLCIVVFCVWSG